MGAFGRPFDFTAELLAGLCHAALVSRGRVLMDQSLARSAIEKLDRGEPFLEARISGRDCGSRRREISACSFSLKQDWALTDLRVFSL
jgi:hypothetical protein